jgi:hypothetical protein
MKYHLLLGNAARPSAVHASSGRTNGQSNFRIEEDTKLARVYAHVSTDAAVGTDQDGATFWGKIRDNFIHRGGGPERTSNSLQNRFSLKYKNTSASSRGHFASFIVDGRWMIMFWPPRSSSSRRC